MFYIKYLAAENGFLIWGASKESSTTAPTQEIVSNTYMEVVPRQRQTVSAGREIYDYIVRVHRRELHTENCRKVQLIPFQFSAALIELV